MPRKPKHFHCYKRLSNGISYRCTKEGCPHSISGREFLLGRKAECPYCGAIFVIDSDHLRRKVLHCLICSKKSASVEEVEAIAAKEEAVKIEAAIEELLKENAIE